MLKRLAIIRKENVRDCPFGISPIIGCSHAGDCVDQMQDLSEVEEYNRAKVRKANRKIYRSCKTGTRCVYADKIDVKHKAVHCDYGEGGERMRDFPMRPSPFYQKIWSGWANGLYAHPLEFYSDNPEARELFTGIYSAYASTGEIHISKVNVLSDPILAELVENIAIKKE